MLSFLFWLCFESKAQAIRLTSSKSILANPTSPNPVSSILSLILSFQSCSCYHIFTLELIFPSSSGFSLSLLSKSCRLTVGGGRSRNIPLQPLLLLLISHLIVSSIQYHNVQSQTHFLKIVSLLTFPVAFVEF